MRAQENTDGARRILVAGDDAATVGDLAQALAHPAVDVETALGGPGALARMEASRPAAVVVERRLAETPGFAAAIDRLGVAGFAQVTGGRALRSFVLSLLLGDGQRADVDGPPAPGAGDGPGPRGYIVLWRNPGGGAS